MTYFEQETGYTCGVACLRMVISAFEKDVPDEAVLIPLLQTNDQVGTMVCDVVRVAQELGYEVIEGQNGTIEILDDLRAKGYQIMLAVSVDVPHWVIYLGNNNNHAFFNDPFFGENKAHELKNFISDKRPFPFFRWRIIASEFKKYFPEYDFSPVESKGLYLAIKK